MDTFRAAKPLYGVKLVNGGGISIPKENGAATGMKLNFEGTAHAPNQIRRPGFTSFGS